MRKEPDPGNFSKKRCVYTTLKSKTLSAFDLASVESLHIQRVLQYTEGNKTQAAKLLKIGVATLYRKIEEYKITL